MVGFTVIVKVVPATTLLPDNPLMDIEYGPIEFIPFFNAPDVLDPVTLVILNSKELIEMPPLEELATEKL